MTKLWRLSWRIWATIKSIYIVWWKQDNLFKRESGLHVNKSSFIFHICYKVWMKWGSFPLKREGLIWMEFRIMQRILAQAKMRKYQNLFFWYFLCFSILHFWRPLGNFWALTGPRSHRTTLNTSNIKWRTLENLSINSDGLWFQARSRKLWLLQVDVFFNIDFCSLL